MLVVPCTHWEADGKSQSWSISIRGLCVCVCVCVWVWVGGCVRAAANEQGRERGEEKRVEE